MRICNYSGNGVCINCDRVPPKGYGDICRRKAEEWLDCLECIIETEWTQEQGDIFADFGIMKNEVRE